MRIVMNVSPSYKELAERYSVKRMRSPSLSEVIRSLVKYAYVCSGLLPLYREERSRIKFSTLGRNEMASKSSRNKRI